MELVKKIKETEAKASEMIEQAKVKAAEDKKKALKEQDEKMQGMKKERNQAIADAVEKAEKQTASEVGEFNSKAEKDREQLKNSCQRKMDGCVEMIVEHIKSLG